MNLPQAFVKQTKELLADEFSDFERALSEPSPTSVRINDKMAYIPSTDKVLWCEKGFYLPERPLFTADPLFHAGVYYVQEASSMFLHQAAQQYLSEAATVLDLCAAPGGKSTLLLQTLPKDSLLVSNEIVRTRANILAENIIKWGEANVVVTNNAPIHFAALPGFFDAIVVDAPCSGEGMFRKDPNSINEWSEQNVRLCAQRQKEILSDVWGALKTDGILIYSTCTYNRSENEENVKWICEKLNAEILEIKFESPSGITKSPEGYHFYPHKTRGEGFFISVLRKKELSAKFKHSKKTKKRESLAVSYKDPLPFALLNSKEWSIQLEENEVKAYPTKRLEDYNLLNKSLNCFYSGLLLGEKKNKDFIPSTAIALSKHLNKTSLEIREVDYKTAIAYLRRETIDLPDLKSGYVLLSYKNQAIGWIKNLGNRTNNLYPKEWRIRMQIEE